MNLSLYKIGIVLIFVLVSLTSFSQDKSVEFFTDSEVILKKYMSEIIVETLNSRRDSINQLFYEELSKVLAHDGAIDYPFDSLKNIGKLVSEDKKVRIITWNVPQVGGYQSYYGFIQLRKENGQVLLYKLTDDRKDIVDPTNIKLPAEKWMAALYYQIIDVKNGSQPYYILLGFDYNNLFSSKKIIEVLTFDENDKPIFGAPIFNIDNKVFLSRIVFEYSARVVVTLKYLPDHQMIVFDHLSPSKPEYAGDFQFYGPDSSFDGFKFEKGQWIYVRDLDMRNPRREKTKLPNAPEKIEDPGFIYKPSSNVKW